MPEQSIAEAVRIAAASILTGLLAVIGFARTKQNKGDYQPKGDYITPDDCEKSHKAYDRYIEEKFNSFGEKLAHMHKDIIANTGMTKKMYDDIYAPKIKSPRSTDSNG